ncbi:MAG: zinc-dependent alcohol dehydrogenase family protein [Burkholderiaceae bacterium]
MKSALIDAYGIPEQVVRCVDRHDPGDPAQGEAVIDVLAFPINPADIWFCKGQYRLRPPLPAVPGAECVGRVVAVGAGVSSPRVGDLVINLQRENWTSRRRVAATDLIPIAPDTDLAQAAMLRINPATALLLLTDLRRLQPGDWVIQNAANSGVGRWVITLARQMGIRTVNVVRRQSLFKDLYARGADVCVLAGSELAARVRAETDNAAISLGLDSIGGEATGQLGACLHDEGLICHFGATSGQDPHLPRNELVHRGLAITGFMLGRFLARRSADDVRELYQGLARLLRDPATHVPVRQMYPLEQIRDAVRHAQQGERGGKILVTPNGPI